LAKQDRSPQINTYKKGCQKKERRKNDEAQRDKDQVENAFADGVSRREKHRVILSNFVVYSAQEQP
jgi:hypothetical protein